MEHAVSQTITVAAHTVAAGTVVAQLSQYLALL
jgi:hypothetical protein